MSAVLESLIEQARTLPMEEQMELAETVFRMAAPADPAWEAAWAMECDRRLGELERGEVEADDFDEVMTRMRRKYLAK